MSARGSNKLFEYVREVNHYCELRPESELAKIKVMPSYILVGDQSSGKTSLLSRLAGIPLGYTANKTGTRRPVEYNLIRDDSRDEPYIEVNSREVNPDNFLNVMVKENGTQGFNDRAVSVKILWKAFPQSIIVVDMPGMKDGDSAPENMILQRLKNSNVIPVVILEPKDFDSKHFAFDLLRRAGRSYADIIAVVNKCDEKMAEKGQWSNQQDWTDFWETANKKGFKNICLIGWPCTSSDRNSQDQLHDSHKHESELINAWRRRVDVSFEALECVGLDKFRQMLHSDEQARLGELLSTSVPLVRREQAATHRKIEELRRNLNSKDSLRKLLSNIFHRWAYKSSELLDGKVDVHKFQESSSTAIEDIEWLASHGAGLLHELPLHSLSTEHLLKSSFFAISEGHDLPDNASWIAAISDSVLTADKELLGKAAFERVLDIVFSASLCRVFQHAMMEFDDKFIHNILAENSQDTGNKVIQVFVKRVLAESLDPMIDVMTLLIWKHLEICFTLAEKPWDRESACLKEVGLQDHFNASAGRYAHELVKSLNQDLHEILEQNGEVLQARYRHGTSNSSIANNFSGNTLSQDTADQTKYNDLSDADFCLTASRFLQMGVEVLERSSVKCRRQRNFYEILHLAALQTKSDSWDVNEVFHSKTQIDAISGVEVQKLQSTALPMSAGKMVTITMDILRQNATSDTPTCHEWCFGILCGSKKTSLADSMINQRSDEEMLNRRLAREESVCLVALNDFKHKRYLACKVPKKSVGGQYQVTFKAEDLENDPSDPDKLVKVDVLCKKVNVTITSVCVSHRLRRPAGSLYRYVLGAAKNGTEEVMKTAMKLMTHVQSNFKPLQGVETSGFCMDFRKLFVDLSCELVEQTVSFRELLEKRLEKLKLTAKKELGHEMTTTTFSVEQVLGMICKANKKQIKKLETYEEVLRKALDHADQYRNPHASDDSDSD